MTVPVLFKATADEVHAIAKRLNGSLISEIPDIYYDRDHVFNRVCAHYRDTGVEE